MKDSGILTLLSEGYSPSHIANYGQCSMDQVDTVINQVKNNNESRRECKECLYQLEKLKTACLKMLQCTGGSQHWNGETYDALRAIEIALGAEL